MDALTRGYEHILRKPLASSPNGPEPVRRLLAVIWRHHGPDALPLLREIYESTDTTHMLLKLVKDHPPRHAPEDPPRLSITEDQAASLEAAMRYSEQEHTKGTT